MEIGRLEWSTQRVPACRLIVRPPNGRYLSPFRHSLRPCQDEWLSWKRIISSFVMKLTANQTACRLPQQKQEMMLTQIWPTFFKCVQEWGRENHYMNTSFPLCWIWPKNLLILLLVRSIFSVYSPSLFIGIDLLSGLTSPSRPASHFSGNLSWGQKRQRFVSGLPPPSIMYRRCIHQSCLQRHPVSVLLRDHCT